jgi:hypothetical protein
MRPRERVAAGLIVCGTDDDFAAYLTAADVAVIDHSSLGLYWALPARPTVAVPVPAYGVNLSAPIAALRTGWPVSCSSSATSMKRRPSGRCSEQAEILAALSGEDDEFADVLGGWDPAGDHIQDRSLMVKRCARSGRPANPAP